MSFSTCLVELSAQEKFTGGEWVVVTYQILCIAQVQVFGPWTLNLLDLTWDPTLSLTKSLLVVVSGRPNLVLAQAQIFSP